MRHISNIQLSSAHESHDTQVWKGHADGIPTARSFCKCLSYDDNDPHLVVGPVFGSLIVLRNYGFLFGFSCMIGFRSMHTVTTLAPWILSYVIIVTNIQKQCYICYETARRPVPCGNSSFLLPAGLGFFGALLDRFVPTNAVNAHLPRVYGLLWHHVFLAGIWHVWKARNDICFNQIPVCPLVIYWKSLAFASDMTIPLLALQGLNLDLINGRWFHSPPGFYKLNVDGSVRDGDSTYGGLLRNHLGERIWEFVGKVAGASTPHGLLTIKEGLLTMHRHGLLKVIIESDSSEAVQLVNGYLNSHYTHFALSLECKNLHKRVWRSSMSFVPRSYNTAADSIAKLGHTFCNTVGTVWLVNPPPSVWMEVCNDNTI